ncbi:MAG: MarR family transcriptional regulator [Thermoprotei archaeon]
MAELVVNAETAWMSVSDTSRKVLRVINGKLLRHDVSLIEVKVLYLLKQQGPVSMARISGELMITPAGATVMVDRLEERGFLRRVHSKDDRRVVYVKLTRKGEEKLEKARSVYTEVIHGLFNAISPSELHALVSIMEKLEKVLEKE